MSKELEFLREDVQNAQTEVEENNQILEELLQNPLVRKFRDTYLKNEAKKKELETLKVSLAYKERIECDHIFVRTEIVSERDYDRMIREPIYHCLRCGLTNAFVVKEVNPVLLSREEIDMAYIFNKTGRNGVLLHEKRICPLDSAERIYKEIKKRTHNLAVTQEEMRMYFIMALSKNDPTYYQDLIYKIRKLAGFAVENDPKVSQRIELRLRDIPTVEDGITHYERSDFNKDLYEIIGTIRTKAGVNFNVITDISKYPELVSEELEKLSEKEKAARLGLVEIPNSTVTPKGTKKKVKNKPE